MSSNESTGSTESVFRTPGSGEGEADLSLHGELDPPIQERELGASPELVGPVTRSGRKRKNSPAQLFMGRRQQTNMLLTIEQLRPLDQKEIKRAVQT